MSRKLLRVEIYTTTRIGICKTVQQKELTALDDAIKQQYNRTRQQPTSTTGQHAHNMEQQFKRLHQY